LGKVKHPEDDRKWEMKELCWFENVKPETETVTKSQMNWNSAHQDLSFHESANQNQPTKLVDWSPPLFHFISSKLLVSVENHWVVRMTNHFSWNIMKSNFLLNHNRSYSTMIERIRCPSDARSICDSFWRMWFFHWKYQTKVPEL
jgi:hypothetical protein